MNTFRPEGGGAVACSLVLPTRNRASILEETLRRVTALPDRGIEIIVVDNGSTDGTANLEEKFPGVRWIWLGRNLGCAARNVGVMAARGGLIFMLDDDSWPESGAVDAATRLFSARPDLGAVACRVRLADPPHRHDAGGVPGVFFNCGGVIRRDAYVAAGGLPIDFDYYVEEYDLACRLLAAGRRIEPHGELVVWHRRVTRNRDNNRMLRLLVRNNMRLWNRYAPDDLRQELLDQTRERYRRVGLRENALRGYVEGVIEGRRALAKAPSRRAPLTPAAFAALFGLDVAQEVLAAWADKLRIGRAAIFHRGKGCEQLIDVVGRVNIPIDAVYDTAVEASAWRGLALRHVDAFDPDRVDGVVVGSLSPGVAEDLSHDFSRLCPRVPVVSAAPWSACSEGGTTPLLHASSGIVLPAPQPSLADGLSPAIC